MFQVQSAVLRHVGRKRSNNEDFVTFFEPGEVEKVETFGRLYVVADGVGGASRGEKASQYAAQKVLGDYYASSDLDTGDRLAHAMRQAGNDIFNHAEQSERFMRMATTLVAAVIIHNQLVVANVGDSRAYLIRDGVVKQISRDHSFVGEMVRDGVMTEEQAMHAKGKNRITRSVGGELDVRVDVFDNIGLKPGDKVLLCSDGLTRYASKQNLLDITSKGNPDSIAKNLINFANQSGGVDNISVAYIEIGQQITPEEFSSRQVAAPPSSVNWETMDTDFGERTVLSRRKPDNKQKFIIIALVVLIGCVFSMFFISPVLSKIFPIGDVELTATITPVVMQTETPTVTIEVTPMPTSTLTPEQTIALTITMISDVGIDISQTPTVKVVEPSLTPTLTFTPIYTLTPTQTMTPTQMNGLTAVVIADPNLYIRTLPDKNSPDIGFVSKGVEVLVLNRNDTGSWVFVRFADKEGWMFADYLQFNGDINSLEVK